MLNVARCWWKQGNKKKCPGFAYITSLPRDDAPVAKLIFRALRVQTFSCHPQPELRVSSSTTSIYSPTMHFNISRYTNANHTKDPHERQILVTRGCWGLINPDTLLHDNQERKAEGVRHHTRCAILPTSVIAPRSTRDFAKLSGLPTSKAPHPTIPTAHWGKSKRVEALCYLALSLGGRACCWRRIT